MFCAYVCKPLQPIEKERQRTARTSGALPQPDLHFLSQHVCGWYAEWVEDGGRAKVDRIQGCIDN
eukprot:8120334-Alexandrium_andersonii.AAC.1